MRLKPAENGCPIADEERAIADFGSYEYANWEVGVR